MPKGPEKHKKQCHNAQTHTKKDENYAKPIPTLLFSE